MDENASRLLRLMRHMRSIYEQGSVDDALVIYRGLQRDFVALQESNPWAGDDEAISAAYSVIYWMGGKEELSAFHATWPQWLEDWYLTVPPDKRPHEKLVRKHS